MLRRLSSKHSNIAESTRSDASDHNTIHTAATAPTSPSPSPDCRSASPRRTPRKSTSLARLKDRFRAHHSGIPDTAPPSRANSVNVVIHSNPRSSAVSEAEETDVEAEAVPSAHHPVHLHRPEPATAEEPDRADPISPDLHPTTTISTSSLPDINHLSLHLDPVLRRLDTIDEPSVNPILVVEEPTPVALGGGTGITR
jgi:osomolarity two-component system response regulator SSK1